MYQAQKSLLQTKLFKIAAINNDQQENMKFTPPPHTSYYETASRIRSYYFIFCRLQTL